jgi:hypothetical protein
VNTATRHFTSYIAVLVICAAAIGGAAIGLAGIASASDTSTTTTVRGPQIVATPNTTASPWVPAPAPRLRIMADPFLVSTGGE